MMYRAFKGLDSEVKYTIDMHGSIKDSKMMYPEALQKLNTNSVT